MKDKNYGSLRRGKPGDSPDRNGIQAPRLHVAMVRLRSNRKRDHPRLFLEEQRRPAVPVRFIDCSIPGVETVESELAQERDPAHELLHRDSPDSQRVSGERVPVMMR